MQRIFVSKRATFEVSLQAEPVEVKTRIQTSPSNYFQR